MPAADIVIVGLLIGVAAIGGAVALGLAVCAAFSFLLPHDDYLTDEPPPRRPCTRQPSHVTVNPGPYDWAADAADQGWGGPT